jgi:hypothetical protein
VRFLIGISLVFLIICGGVIVLFRRFFFVVTLSNSFDLALWLRHGWRTSDGHLVGALLAFMLSLPLPTRYSMFLCVLGLLNVALCSGWTSLPFGYAPPFELGREGRVPSTSRRPRNFGLGVVLMEQTGGQHHSVVPPQDLSTLLVLATAEDDGLVVSSCLFSLMFVYVDHWL